MNRGDVWLAEVGRKRRPVLVLTRTQVLDVRAMVTVAEVEFDHVAAGVDRESVINCDGLHTVAQATLTARVGEVDESTMGHVCSAVSYALGC